MTVIQKMLSGCIELEGKFCNRRVTKFMKTCGNVDSRELRHGMKIDFEFSNCLQTSYCQKNSIVAILRHVIAGEKRLRKLRLKKLLR